MRETGVQLFPTHARAMAYAERGCWAGGGAQPGTHPEGMLDVDVKTRRGGHANFLERDAK